MMPLERAAFIESQLSEDPELLALLQRVLFLVQRPGRNELLTKVFSGWKILFPLGANKLYMDYLAEREDGSVEQLVMLKVSRGTLERASTREDFLQEIRMLEMLYDPQIARVLDSGWVSEGRPFVVTEFEAGLPVTDSGIKLGVRQTLEVFQRILSIVGYAHQRRIMDGRLEPFNILLTHQMEPRIVDFGLSRAFSLCLDPAGAGGQREGNRSVYRAPEPMGGLQFQESADVYSLGVILFEVLSGKRPYDPAGGEAKAQGGESGETAPAKVESLDDDLNYILARAVRLNPEERYSNVTTFSKDIQTYLDGRPVMPRQEPISAFAWRLVEKNLVTIILLVAVLGVGLFAYAQRGKQDDSGSFLKKFASIFLSAGGSVAKGTGNAGLSKLQEVREYVFSFLSKGQASPEELRDKAKEYLRQAEIELKQNGQLSGDRGRAILSARQTYELMLQSSNREGASEIELFESGRAASLLVNLLGEAKDYPEAIRVAQEWKNKLMASASSSVELQRALAQADGTVSDLMFAAGDRQASLPIARASVKQYETIWQADPENVVKTREYVQLVNKAGRKALQLNEASEAMALFRKAESAIRPQAAKLNTEVGLAVDLAGSTAGVGAVFAESKQMPKAQKSYKESQKLLEQALTKEKSNEEVRFALADVLTQSARVNRDWGELDKALREAEKSIQLVKSLIGKSSARGEYHRQLAVSLTMRGQIIEDQKNREAARATYEEASKAWAAYARLASPRPEDEFEIKRLKSLLER